MRVTPLWRLSEPGRGAAGKAAPRFARMRRTNLCSRQGRSESGAHRVLVNVLAWDRETCPARNLGCPISVVSRFTHYIATVARLDQTGARDQVCRTMRRLWFAILLVMSLAVGATASAWAGQACPYKQAEAASASHDCCPDQQPAPQPSDHHDNSIECQLGQSCRATHAVEPLVPILKSARVEVAVAISPRDQQAIHTTAPAGLWRPPRTA